MPICAVCGNEMKLIPAGVSKKTGKAYQAFMACPNKCVQPKGNPAPKPADVFKGEMTQEKKEESMAWLNAKKGACELVAAEIKAGIISEVDNVIDVVKDYAVKIYNLKV